MVNALKSRKTASSGTAKPGRMGLSAFGSRRASSVDIAALAGRGCLSMPSVPRIDWSADGDQLLLYSPGDPTGTSRLGVCDVRRKLSVTPVDVHGGLVSAARFAAGATRILVGFAQSVRGFGTLWQLDRRSAAVTQVLGLGAGVAVAAVALSPDGRLAAAGTMVGVVYICDLTGRDNPRVLVGHDGPVSALQFSDDARVMVTASADGTICLWNTGTGVLIRRLPGHEQPVSSAAFLSQCGEIISSGIDGTIRLWDAMNGDEVWRAEADPFCVNSVSVAPGGERAASGGLAGTIIFWDVRLGRRLIEFTAHAAAVAALGFSPDGRLLASSSYDGTIRLWDVATVDTAASTVPGHPGNLARRPG